MKKLGIKIGGTIAIPAIVLLTVLIISLSKGILLFENELHWMTFIRSTCSVLLVTFALSINLNSGRFDFSLGSIALLSSIISSQIAIKTGIGAVGMMFISLIMGAILGLFSGGVYVLTKLPPIIVSLAITLLYEGLAFMITKGYGVSLISYSNIMSFASIPNYLIIIVVVLAIITVLFDFTKFGFNYKALQSGQKVAVETGINEKLNCLICYLVCGALMGIQGFISATTNGTIQMSLNFGSISPMFMAFFPMFIGGFIARFSHDKIGYLIGAITSAILSLFYVRANVDSSIQQIISAIILVVFLIYLNNEGIIKKVFSFSFLRKKKKDEQV